MDGLSDGPDTFKHSPRRRRNLEVLVRPKVGVGRGLDGEAVGKATAEELGKGWNLANSCGPIQQQARLVLDLVFKKNDAYFNRWRNVQLYQAPDWANGPEIEAKRTAQLARMDKEIAEFEGKINAALKLKAHHFEVKPAGN